MKNSAGSECSCNFKLILLLKIWSNDGTRISSFLARLLSIEEGGREDSPYVLCKLSERGKDIWVGFPAPSLVA